MQAKPVSAHSSGGAGVSLHVLILFLALFGLGLFTIVGLPHTANPPLEIPDPISLEALLRSSHPPLDAPIYLVGMIGWVVWGWLIISLVLQLLAAGAERIAAGTTAVRRLRTVADVLSVPLVRKAVETSLAGSMVVRVALAGVPTAAAAAPQDRPVVVTAVSPHSFGLAASMSSGVWATSEEPADDIPTGSVIYTVQPGDNLAKIADRFYADGDRWQVLYEANQGRRMQDGATFNRAGVIHPGWRLIVPEPSEAIHTDADGRRWYTVRKGDSLAGISARLLGDEQRWRELFAANQGVRLDEGRVLSDPRLIWPGLELQLPDLNNEAAPTVEVEPGPPPTPPTPASPPITQPTTPAAPPAPVVEMAPPPPAPAPTPAPTEVPFEAPIVEPQPPEPRGVQLPTWAPEAAGVATGVALIGLGLAGARRSRRPRSPWDETDIQVIGGFAQATGDETQYEDQATALANQVVAFVDEHGCSNVQLLGVYAGRTGAGLVLSVDAEQADKLAAAASAFGAQSSSVRLKGTDAGDYQWEQSWSSVRPRPVARDQAAAIQLLPVGLAGDRRVLYANAAASGTLLVAGRTSSGVRELLATLVVDRARRRRPDELYLLTVAKPDRLEPRLAALPHQRAGVVDPGNERLVSGVLQEIRQELERRLEHGQADSPDVLLVVDEWAELTHQGTVLDLLAHHGPPVGITVLAATTRTDDVDLERWVGLFRTRLVLQTPDETSSARLLGEPGAEDLDAVGQLWPWVQGRLLHRVRGFRMPPAHLADLVERMRERTRDEPKLAPNSLFDLDDDTRVERPVGDATADELEREVSAEPSPDLSIGFSRANGSDTSISASPLAPHAAAPTITCTPATPTDPMAHQLALIGAGALVQKADSSAEPEVLKTEAADPLVELYLFGNQSSLVRGHDVASRCSAALSKYRQAWSLFLAIAALPATKASTTAVGTLVWPASSDDVDAMSNRLRSNLANARQILRSAGLSDAEARRVVRTEGGLCLLDRVRVDVWDFLEAQREGNRAWAARHQAAALAAYQRARALYAGPLLDKQDATHPWIHERVADGLTLRESYHSQWRQVTERVAELLVDANHHAEAAQLYRELLLDPFALPSRDKDVAEAREAHARALFGCCQDLGDLAALERAFEDLQRALETDDVASAAPSRTHPSPATMEALAEARQHLRTQIKDGAAVADD